LWAGAEDEIALGVERDIYLTIPRGQENNIKAVMNIDEIIKAPVTAGKVYGELVMSLNGEELLREPMVALQSIKEGGLFKRLWDGLVLFFSGLIGL
jgi:D-alanyl-D-alanine carboxypeptidase (penicillin-binding protein 5/6)